MGISPHTMSLSTCNSVLPAAALPVSCVWNHRRQKHTVWPGAHMACLIKRASDQVQCLGALPARHSSPRVSKSRDRSSVHADKFLLGSVSGTPDSGARLPLYADNLGCLCLAHQDISCGRRLLPSGDICRCNPRSGADRRKSSRAA